MAIPSNGIVNQIHKIDTSVIRQKTGECLYTSTIRKPHQFKTLEEISNNAKVRFTRDGMCLITCFDKNRYRESGWEELEHFYDGALEKLEPKKVIPKSEPTQAEREKYRKDSLTRAKKKVFEIASANEWHYMVTFTLNQEHIDRYDTKEVQKRFSTWLSNMVQRHGLRGLFVPERHKDGAIHFHGLINDALDMSFSKTYKVKGIKKPMGIRKLKNKGKTPDDADVKKVYNIDQYKLGFSTAIPLDEQSASDDAEKNITKVSHYITKYCTKDLDKIFGSYYIAVGKIERELPFLVCNMDFEELAKHGKVIKLPEKLGAVCYATMTRDTFEGIEIL